jgi:hypothetical protein
MVSFFKIYSKLVSFKPFIYTSANNMNARSRTITERLSIADLELLNLQEGHGFFIERRQQTVDLILSYRGMVSEAFE